MYKAVIFDLDGVITDTARYHFVAWKRLANQMGLDIDEQFNEKLKGIDRMSSLDLIIAEGIKTYSDAEKLKLANQKNEDYKVLIESMSDKDLLPGAEATLKGLRDMGLKIALASASKNAPFILEKLGISELFDAIADANKVTKSKPAPDIFLLAASEIGIEPKACVGVEDAVAGVDAIKSANMYAVGVGDPKVLVDADIVIPDLTKFPLGAKFEQTFAKVVV